MNHMEAITKPSLRLETILIFIGNKES